MTAEEQFEIYKADFDKKQLKRARIIAVVLGLSTIITVVAMLFAAINSIEAGTWREQAIRSEQTAIESKLVADKVREQANELEKQLTICKSEHK